MSLNFLKKNFFIAIILITMPHVSISSAMNGDDKPVITPSRPPIPAADMPFLIKGKLPHLTLIIKRHWDDPALGLDQEQKRKLALIRKQTISEVKQLAKKLKEIENQIAKMAIAGTPPQELYPLVDEAARLRAEATKIQLRCIHETRLVLRKEQMKLLLNLFRANEKKGAAGRHAPNH